MTEPKQKQTIGQINGPWAIMLRVQLASYIPLILLFISYCTWMTVEQFKDKNFREAGPRFTAIENDLADAQQMALVMQVIADLPAPDWKDRITAIEKLAAENKDILTRVLTILEERDKP